MVISSGSAKGKAGRESRLETSVQDATAGRGRKEEKEERGREATHLLLQRCTVQNRSLLRLGVLDRLGELISFGDRSSSAVEILLHLVSNQTKRRVSGALRKELVEERRGKKKKVAEPAYSPPEDSSSQLPAQRSFPPMRSSRFECSRSSTMQMTCASRDRRLGSWPKGK